jgi:hypothetical protein
MEKCAPPAFANLASRELKGETNRQDVGVRKSVLDCGTQRNPGALEKVTGRICRCVELRALCDESPQTPPGPEGSNGSGIDSGAAEYPKFLSSLQSLEKSPAA